MVGWITLPICGKLQPAIFSKGLTCTVRCFLLGVLLLSSWSVHAEDAATLIAHDKAAAGGTHWDSVQTIETTGTLHTGGLDGSFRTLQDLVHLRAFIHHRWERAGRVAQPLMVKPPSTTSVAPVTNEAASLAR